MATKHELMAVMVFHIGSANGIRGEDLAKKLGIDPRKLRDLKDELIRDGISFCGHPSTGYFIAKTAEELKKTCDFHHARAMHELENERILKQTSLGDLVGQLHLKT